MVNETTGRALASDAFSSAALLGAALSLAELSLAEGWLVAMGCANALQQNEEQISRQVRYGSRNMAPL